MEETVKKNVEVETFSDDMAGMIGENENGAIKKIIEEEEKYNAEYEKVSPESKRNKIFLYVGILLVALSFGAVALVYLLRTEIFTVEVAPQYVPVVFTDKTEFKEIGGFSKDQVIETILNEAKTADYKSGGLEGIYLTINKKVVGFRQFLDLLEANLDKSKIEFIGDDFLIGSYNNDSKDLFILLKMRSVVDVFDAMRAWESKMFSDLHGLFGVEINADTKYLLDKNFEDGIIQNKNARILYDNNGKVVLSYVFAEDDSLIITNSEPAVAEVISRLDGSQIKK